MNGVPDRFVAVWRWAGPVQMVLSSCTYHARLCIPLWWTVPLESGVYIHHKQGWLKYGYLCLNITEIYIYKTLLVIHTILDAKLSKFDVIIYQHMFITNIEETVKIFSGRRIILYTSCASKCTWSTYFWFNNISTLSIIVIKTKIETKQLLEKTQSGSSVSRALVYRWHRRFSKDSSAN